MKCLGPTRDALITAFIAGDLFIVLPILIESCKGLLTKYGAAGGRSSDLPDVLVPASFNFPHTGKLLSLSFILFAGWFAGAPVPVTALSAAGAHGTLDVLRQPQAAVPFLLDLFRIPADTFQLFVATGVINARFGTLDRGRPHIAVALLGSAAVAGTMRFEARRVIRYLVITGVLTWLTVGGLRVMFRTLLPQEFKGAEIVYGMTNLLEHDATRVVPQFPAEEPGGVGARERIRARGTLRVGFAVPRLPFVFRNGRGDLVGFDIELAHLLARDLGVKVEFAEWPGGELAHAVTAGQCDMGIGGTPVTPMQATETLFSEPYIDETLAFVVKDHLRGRFETWASIQGIRDLTIGVPPLPYYEQALKARLPGVRMQEFDRHAGSALATARVRRGRDAGRARLGDDAAESEVDGRRPAAGSDQDSARVSARAAGSGTGRASSTRWIELKRRDGSLDGLYSHWILGKASRRPRAPSVVGHP